MIGVVKILSLMMLPVKYEVNCFGPHRTGNLVVDFTSFSLSRDPSLGQNTVPLVVSPHHRNRIRVSGGGLAIVHSTLLNVTLRKHRTWPSTRGGMLVEGDTSLTTGKEKKKVFSFGAKKRNSTDRFVLYVEHRFGPVWLCISSCIF